MSSKNIKIIMQVDEHNIPKVYFNQNSDSIHIHIDFPKDDVMKHNSPKDMLDFFLTKSNLPKLENWRKTLI